MQVFAEPTPVSLSWRRSADSRFGPRRVGNAADAASKRLFVVNGANGTVDMLDISNPALPVRAGSISGLRWARR
jgi:hypothetical protein